MVIYKPPTGFNTWNTFGNKFDEKTIKEIADALVSTGLRNVGYEYLIIDDFWLRKRRDENGKLTPNSEKFPNGIKTVIDYIHSKGLK